MATIRKRSNGVWEVRVFTGRGPDGKPTQTSRTVRGTRRDADQMAKQLEAKPPSHAGGRTVADALSAWLEVNEAVWAPASQRDNASRVKRILADPIATIGLARLGVADVERWHARMRRQGVGAAAIRGRHAALRAALSQAVRWEWIATNPAAAARLRQQKTAQRGAMTADDVRAVIEAAREVDEAAALALRLAAIGGLRRSELAALRWDDIDDDVVTVDKSAEVVRIGDGLPPTVRTAPTKTANHRRLRLDPATLELVESLREERTQVSPFMFSLTSGPAHPDRIGWWWSRARALSGIDSRWRLHDLRHWTATTAINKGHDVRSVAGRLGHANAAMTLRVYAHAVSAADATIASTLAEALDQP